MSTKCTRWPGTHRADGRPIACRRYVYRIVYEQCKGRLHAAQVLHHTCGNVWCINPTHLVALLQGEHLKLHGLDGDNHQRFKTECPRGHAYDDANTYHYKGERMCKACRRDAKLRYLTKYRAEKFGA